MGAFGGYWEHIEEIYEQERIARQFEESNKIDYSIWDY